MSRHQAVGVILHKKCEFSKTTIKFLGQVIGASGVSADPDKVNAVKAMKEPSNVSEVRGLLGMINHLGKFLPHLAEKKKLWSLPTPHRTGWEPFSFRGGQIKIGNQWRTLHEPSAALSRGMHK